MANLNKSEYGQTIHINFSEDISSATAFNFILEPKQGEKLEKTAADGVVLGTSNVDVGDETYVANQYISYTVKEGDLDYAGQWRKKAEATMSATNKITTDYELFEVLE